MSRLIEVTELALRDGHQSLLATRMALEDMTPVCEAVDQAGFWSVECWGGAT
jgi:methylmalonyl-CoA carboxyltransferase 5S subunit